MEKVEVTAENVDFIINTAFSLAHTKTQEYISGMTDWWPCGFSWVVIRPARGILAKRLKERGLGDKGYSGGLCVWDPARSMTQSMYAKEAGAIAFANYLKLFGINASVETRID